MLGRILGFLLKLSALLVLLAALAGTWLVMEARSALEQSITLPPEGLDVTVPPGASMNRVARELAGQGIVVKPRFLTWAARWTGQAGRIRTGEYRLVHGMTARQMLDLFVSGRVVEHRFTIVEGWTFRQMRAELSRLPELRHTLDGAPQETIMERLGYPGRHPEGLFLPETYRFPRGTTDVQFLRRAYQAMERVLESEWRAREDGLPLKTPYEALILASIVERETGLADERPRIAGVFVRRLRQGMRLQTDPTVIYGMGDRFDGNLRSRDLKRDTPYNTYVHKGLPPTPIALPGQEAIHAVLHPVHSNELFFVARGDGSHQFSETLAAHQQAVRRYQLRRR